MAQSAAPSDATLDSDLNGPEALHFLAGMAIGKFGHMDGALLAEHVYGVTDGGDWPVKLEAMEALLRRFKFANRDGLRVASRPKGSPFGLYSTRRLRAKQRPYATQLHSVLPLRASCDCPDFPLNSLGLCKHVLIVLDDLWQRPRKRIAALVPVEERTIPAGLRWNPIRPLDGAGDWLARLSWHPGQQPGQAARSKRVPSTGIQNIFKPGVHPEWTLRSTFSNSPKSRAELIAQLIAIARAGGQQHNLESRAIDAAVIPLLRAEADTLARGEKLSARELSRGLRGMHRKLYPYQRTGVQHFARTGSLLLADDMGLGKTAQAIACCHLMHTTKKVKRGLLIMPASLKAQWLREWKAFTPTQATVVEGSPAERAATYRTCHDGFLIINYELLLRDLESIQAFSPQMVVLDEAQRIKNWQTKTSMSVKRLNPDYRLVLTGTPMENRLEELASIMQWVDRPALEPAWRLLPWHITEGGARNLETLRARLAPNMLRRIRREVLDQLPERTDTLVPLPLTPEQAQEHIELDQPIARLAHTSKRRPLTQAEFLRLMGLLATQRMICNGLALVHHQEMWPQLQGTTPNALQLKGLFSPKLEELRELMQALVVNQGRKVVIFSQWRRMLQLAHWAMADVLEVAGARAVFFTGRESQRQRDRNVIDFHDDDAVQVLLCSDAGGVGLNLQRASSCCINLELPWNPAVLEQRIGRVYRLGQSQPVDVYNLVSAGGIEARIATLVGNKQALFDGVFDGSSDEVQFDEAPSFMARLDSIVETPLTPEVEALEEDTDIGPADSGSSPTDKVSSIDIDSSTSSGRGKPSVAALEPPVAPTSPSANQLANLASELNIQVKEDGSVQLTAPPGAAKALLGFFENLSQQLRNQD